MITRIGVLNKFNEAVKNLQFEKYAIRLLDSGAINLADYENNYSLPLIILSAILKDYADNAYAKHHAKAVDALVPFINRGE